MNSPTWPDRSNDPTLNKHKMFEAGVTKDAFFGGAFHLLQPAGRGFRAGHDALLLASCNPPDMDGRALDMGAGTGAVAFAAAVRAPALSLVMAERNAEMIALAERSRCLTENAALALRLSVVTVDLLDTRPKREAADLRDGSFDLVLTNPPFHPPGQRRSPDALRDEARALPDGAFLPRWLQVAAALLRHGGRFLMIGRPENLHQLLPAADNRLGALTVLPIHSALDAPASRILVSGVRGSRLPIRILPSVVLDAALRDEVSKGRHVFSVLEAR